MPSNNDHIPTSEIISDIADTELEIKQLRDEIEVLSRDRIKNRTAIYMSEGNILNRRVFIEKLNDILGERNAF